MTLVLAMVGCAETGTETPAAPPDGAAAAAGQAEAGPPADASSSGLAPDGGGAVGPSDGPSGADASAGGVDAPAGVAPGDAAPADGGTSGPRIAPTASELVFSGVRGRQLMRQPFAISNAGTEPLRVTRVALVSAGAGSNTALFSLNDAPTDERVLDPGTELSFPVSFLPTGSTQPGVHRAILRITSTDPARPSLDVGLFGLATLGEQGTNEPTLKNIVDTLGFAIDVGGPELHLPTRPTAIGEEVLAPRFVRAAAGPVTLEPVARYSPDEPLPFGYYVGEGAPMFKQVAVIATGNEQTLFPMIDPNGSKEFDPGDASFGLYCKSRSHTTHTEDRLNTSGTRHAVRTYPLKDRAGTPVPNAYLVCFEEAANGDYQDYVFVMRNAKPAP
jgi:hypothetical protein